MESAAHFGEALSLGSPPGQAANAATCREGCWGRTEAVGAGWRGCRNGWVEGGVAVLAPAGPAVRLVLELRSAVLPRGRGILMHLAVVLRETPPGILGHRVTESVENRDRLDQCLLGDGCPADSGELPAQLHE